jgi:hypothetical protein
MRSPTVHGGVVLVIEGESYRRRQNLQHNHPDGHRQCLNEEARVAAEEFGHPKRVACPTPYGKDPLRLLPGGPGQQSAASCWGPRSYVDLSLEEVNRDGFDVYPSWVGVMAYRQRPTKHLVCKSTSTHRDVSGWVAKHRGPDGAHKVIALIETTRASPSPSSISPTISTSHRGRSSSCSGATATARRWDIYAGATTSRPSSTAQIRPKDD